MQVTGMTPMLGVADPERSLAFYRDALGFTVSGEHHHEGRLTWAHLARDVLEHAMLYLYVDDVRAFCAECRANDLDVSEPVARFYGLLEARLRDPDGYTILIGEETGEEWSHPAG